jgi:hypothetical protein
MVDFGKQLKLAKSVDLHTGQLKRIHIENPEASMFTLSDYVSRMPEDVDVLKGIIKKLCDYGWSKNF